MDKLLSVEFLVRTVLMYNDKISDLPHSKDIEINVKLGDRISFKITRDLIKDSTVTDENVKVNDNNVTYSIFSGQSVVLPTSEADMRSLLKNNKFEIELIDLNKVTTMGTCSLEIPDKCIDYVASEQKEPKEEKKETPEANETSDANENPETPETDISDKNTPNILDEAVRIDKDGEKVGIIELHIRFTNFGNQVTTKFQTCDSQNRGRYFFKNDMCDQGFQIQKMPKGVPGTVSKFSNRSMPMTPLLGHQDIDGNVLKPLFVNPFKEHASIMVSVFRPVRAAEDEVQEKQRKEPMLTPSKIRKLLCGNSYCPVATKFRDLGIGPFAPLKPNLGAPTGRESPHTLIGMSQMYGTNEYYGPYGLLKQKGDKCVCLEDEVREYREPCGCLANTSVWAIREKCGYGRCPFNERMEPAYNNNCCLRGSDESVFFVPGFVPRKRDHCRSSICSAKMSDNRCQCTVESQSDNHVPCGFAPCPMTKVKKTCDCQAEIERLRGGEDNFGLETTGKFTVKSSLKIRKVYERCRAGQDRVTSSSTAERPESYCPKCKRTKSYLKTRSQGSLRNSKHNELFSKTIHKDESRISLRKVAPAVYPRLRAGNDCCGCGCKGFSEPPCVIQWRENSVPKWVFPEGKRRHEYMDDELECDGWDEEEIFFNEKIVQSYGLPAPRFRDPTIPECLGGSRPCNCRRAPPKPDCCESTNRRNARARSSIPPGCTCTDTFWCDPCEPQECRTCVDLLEGSKQCGLFTCANYKIKKDMGLLGPEQCAFGKGKLMSDRDNSYFIAQEIAMENCGYSKCPIIYKQELMKKFEKITKKSACTDPDCPFRYTDCAIANEECGSLLPPNLRIQSGSNLGSNVSITVTKPSNDLPIIIPSRNKEDKGIVDLTADSLQFANDFFEPLNKIEINEELRKIINRKESPEQREIWKTATTIPINTFVSEWYDGTLDLNEHLKCPRNKYATCRTNKIVPNWCPHRQRKIEEKIQNRISCYFLTNNNCEHCSSRLRGGMNDLCEKLEKYIQNSSHNNSEKFEMEKIITSIGIENHGENNIRLRAGMDITIGPAKEDGKDEKDKKKDTKSAVSSDDTEDDDDDDDDDDSDSDTGSPVSENIAIGIKLPYFKSSKSMKSKKSDKSKKSVKMKKSSKKMEDALSEKEVKVSDMQGSDECCKEDQEECDLRQAEMKAKEVYNCGTEYCPKNLTRNICNDLINRKVSRNILNKNHYDDFEPFYIKPVPRYTFKKYACTDKSTDRNVPLCVQAGLEPINYTQIRPVNMCVGGRDCKGKGTATTGSSGFPMTPAGTDYFDLRLGGAGSPVHQIPPGGENVSNSQAGPSFGSPVFPSLPAGGVDPNQPTGPGFDFLNPPNLPPPPPPPAPPTFPGGQATCPDTCPALSRGPEELFFRSAFLPALAETFNYTTPVTGQDTLTSDQGINFGPGPGDPNFQRTIDTRRGTQQEIFFGGFTMEMQGGVFVGTGRESTLNRMLNEWQGSPPPLPQGDTTFPQVPREWLSDQQRIDDLCCCRAGDERIPSQTFGSSPFDQSSGLPAYGPDIESKMGTIGYCGMQGCALHDETDQTCGDILCPALHAQLPGMQSGDRNPLVVQKLITLESCGAPNCPFSNPETLEAALTELTKTGDDGCSITSCPYKDSTCPYFAPTTPSTDRDREEAENDTSSKKSHGSIAGKRRVSHKKDPDVSKDQSMNNYVSSNLEEEVEVEIKPKISRGTCKKSTCKRLVKCKECGGISLSGATCDNPNVPFDPSALEEIYEVDEEAQKRREERREARRLRREATPPPEQKPATKDKERYRHPLPKNTRFVYRGGKYYPGVHCGHRTCFQTAKNVPGNMGWLWNTPPGGRLRNRKGWRPGVIGKSLMERIRQRREEMGIPDPPELKIISKKKTAYGQESEESEEEVEPRPTLYIKKKEGAYYITVHPLKDPRTVVEREDPYLNCTPMQFVITRRKPLKAPSISSLQCENGSELSSDESTIECLCDEQEPEPEVSSSSDSELSIEFTTPAGLIFPEDMKRKPNIVHTEIQYKEADLNDPDLPFIIIQKKKKKKGVRF